MTRDRSAAADAILGFWLDAVGPKGWYVPDPATDAEIARRFGALWREAARDPASAWMASARLALAHLVLLDQFPRNMFRGEARAFATDRLALARARLALDQGHDLRIAEPARQFFYLPFMHSESAAHQALCLALVRERLPETGAENLRHGALHRDVLRRFGRFPSRNAALGRRDGDGETAYRGAGGYMG